MLFQTPLFENRRDAGRRLGRRLRDTPAERPVVVGLARGGVVVAAEVARALQAPLDAVAVRKVGHPRQPEYALGAVAPGAGAFVRARDGLTDQEVAAVVEATRREADSLDARLHARAAPVPLEGRTAVLVDDGLATGATMVAACRWARLRGASRVVAAVPVAAAHSLPLVEPEADEVVTLEAPEAFWAVGLWYGDFRPVDDDDVVALLAADAGAATASA